MRRLLLGMLLVPLCGYATALESPASTQAPTVAEIIDRNVAARGGLDAWRRIHAMVWSGHLEGGSTEAGSMAFVLEQARPNRTRFEIESMGQKSVRAFDGTSGWKLRPSRGIRPDVQPFTPEEARFARDAEVIDGPLIDYAAHGSHVHLVGLEDQHGRKAWHIDVVRASGAQEAVWVDAETFLDVRYDRTSYRSSGGAVRVTVYYRDFHEFEGVQVPTVVEIANGDNAPASRMVVEHVSLNPDLGEHAFESPDAASRHRAGFPGSRSLPFEKRGAADRAGTLPRPATAPDAEVPAAPR